MLSSIRLLVVTAALAALGDVSPAAAQNAQSPTPPATPAGSSTASTSSTADDTNEYGTPLADYWLDHHVELDLNPIGYTVQHKGFIADTLTPIHPAGLPSDHYYALLGIPGATYGFGNGLQAEVAITGAEQRGGPGEATFYGFGLQQRLFGGRRPDDVSVSVGGYGYVGPRGYYGGTGYLAASKRIFGEISPRHPALFLHTGVKTEAFNNEHLETFEGRRHSSGLRPFVGANLTLGSRVFVLAEFAPGQSWEPNNEYSVRAQYYPLVRRIHALGISGHLYLGITGGVRNSGYRTVGFVGPTFDFKH